ncbi:hypothetical protein BJ684DRAFT_16678, partial [Piptocephalis cylindrospora]
MDRADPALEAHSLGVLGKVQVHPEDLRSKEEFISSWVSSTAHHLHRAHTSRESQNSPPPPSIPSPDGSLNDSRRGAPRHKQLASPLQLVTSPTLDLSSSGSSSLVSSLRPSSTRADDLRDGDQGKKGSLASYGSLRRARSPPAQSWQSPVSGSLDPLSPIARDLGSDRDLEELLARVDEENVREISQVASTTAATPIAPPSALPSMGTQSGPSRLAPSPPRTASPIFPIPEPSPQPKRTPRHTASADLSQSFHPKVVASAATATNSAPSPSSSTSILGLSFQTPVVVTPITKSTLLRADKCKSTLLKYYLSLAEAQAQDAWNPAKEARRLRREERHRQREEGRARLRAEKEEEAHRAWIREEEEKEKEMRLASNPPSSHTLHEDKALVKPQSAVLVRPSSAQGASESDGGGSVHRPWYRRFRRHGRSTSSTDHLITSLSSPPVTESKDFEIKEGKEDGEDVGLSGQINDTLTDTGSGELGRKWSKKEGGWGSVLSGRRGLAPPTRIHTLGPSNLGPTKTSQHDKELLKQRSDQQSSLSLHQRSASLKLFPSSSSPSPISSVAHTSGKGGEEEGKENNYFMTPIPSGMMAEPISPTREVAALRASFEALKVSRRPWKEGGKSGITLWSK